MPTKIEMFVDFLLQFPNGVHKDEIKAHFNIKDSQVYTMMNALRRKGYKIKNNDSKYQIKYTPMPKDVVPAQNTSVQVTQKSDIKVQGHSKKKITLSLEDMRTVDHLPPEDRNDYIDLIKKAMFYKGCAEALLMASSYAENLKGISKE